VLSVYFFETPARKWLLSRFLTRPRETMELASDAMTTILKLAYSRAPQKCQRAGGTHAMPGSYPLGSPQSRAAVRRFWRPREPFNARVLRSAHCGWFAHTTRPEVRLLCARGCHIRAMRGFLCSRVITRWTPANRGQLPGRCWSAGERLAENQK